MNHKRTRYQHGSLTIEKRKNGSSVWVYRWRETDAAGKPVRRKRIVGTKLQYLSKAAAMRAVEGLRLDINTEGSTNASSSVTLDELVSHYMLIELGPEANKTYRTKAVYTQHLKTYILPRWGSYELGTIKAFAVESWLKSVPKAPGTKAKTRNVFSALYQHAIRYGWLTHNPIREVRQSSKRQSDPDILTPEEVRGILDELPEPCRTMVVVAATTGLRRGELIGLTWQDIRWDAGQVMVLRSVVDQRSGNTKTAGSKRPLPLAPQAVDALRRWRKPATMTDRRTGFSPVLDLSESVRFGRIRRLPSRSSPPLRERAYQRT